MNAFELLKADHEKVKKLLEKIAHASDKAIVTKEENFNKVVEEVKAHSKMEEKVFYPKLKENPKTRALILEAYEEHHLVDKLMSEVNKVDVGDEKWKAKFTVMEENLKHHIKEEEESLFPLVEEVLTEEEIEELGKELKEFKKNNA